MLFVFSCIARWIVFPFLRSSLPPTLPTYTPQDTHGGTFSSILLIFMPCKVAGLVFFVLILRLLFVVSTTTTYYYSGFLVPSIHTHAIVLPTSRHTIIHQLLYLLRLLLLWSFAIISARTQS